MLARSNCRITSRFTLSLSALRFASVPSFPLLLAPVFSLFFVLCSPAPFLGRNLYAFTCRTGVDRWSVFQHAAGSSPHCLLHCWYCQPSVVNAFQVIPLSLYTLLYLLQLCCNYFPVNLPLFILCGIYCLMNLRAGTFSPIWKSCSFLLQKVASYSIFPQDFVFG